MIVQRGSYAVECRVTPYRLRGLAPMRIARALRDEIVAEKVPDEDTVNLARKD